MKILVIGDHIKDVYTFGKATRICPEAPVPVIVPEREYSSDGGAGLTFNQLKALGADVTPIYGSFSVKRRVFAGSHLVCRIDKDAENCVDWRYDFDKYDAIVVSDYGKGAMRRSLAETVVATGKPCFVDAKNHFWWYSHPNVVAFPNEHENVYDAHFGRVVRKLGAKGCQSGTLVLPATVSEVVDTTGAGDVFMAGFVYAWSVGLKPDRCLEFANILAGRSCQFVGTHVVDRAFAQEVLDRLRFSSELQQQALDHPAGSSSAEPSLQPPRDRWDDGTAGAPESCTLHEDSPRVGSVRESDPCTPHYVQNLLAPSSGPTESSATPTPADQETSHWLGKI